MTFGFTIFDWFDFWLIFSADEKMEFFNRTFFSNRKNKTNKWGKSSLNNLHKEKNVNGGDHCHGHHFRFIYIFGCLFIQKNLNLHSNVHSNIQCLVCHWPRSVSNKTNIVLIHLHKRICLLLPAYCFKTWKKNFSGINTIQKERNKFCCCCFCLLKIDGIDHHYRSMIDWLIDWKSDNNHHHHHCLFVMVMVIIRYFQKKREHQKKNNEKSYLPI